MLTTFTKSQVVTVNFSIPTSQVPPMFYSLNIWDGTNPAVANDIVYQQQIDSLKLKLVRFHASETYVNGNAKNWINFSTQTWNATAINAALSALQGKVQNRLISIFNFPVWFNNNNKYIPASMAPQFGKWCADLVRLVNKQSPHYTKYWEVFNELEMNYVGQGAALATIYNTAVDSMKAVDSTIRVGGLSLSQPYWSVNDQKTFYQNAATRLDFVTYHHYGGANSMAANTSIYNTAKSIAVTGANAIRSTMTQAGLPANKPLWLGEANIVWTWTGDTLLKKQRSRVGAVYDALLFSHALQNGKLSSVQLFNERDGVYGKLSSTNVRRPAYHVLRYFSENLYGSTHTFSCSLADTLVYGSAISNATGQYLVLINRSLTARTLSLVCAGLSAPVFQVERTAVNDSLKQSNFISNTSAFTQTISPETVVFLKLTPANVNELTKLSKFEAHCLFYPNPNKGLVRIESAEPVEVIELFGTDGRFIKRFKISGTNSELNLFGYPKGIYNTLIIFKTGKQMMKSLIIE